MIKKDYEIQQGETFFHTYTFTDGKEPPAVYDLSGYSARMEIRDYPGAAELISAATCAVNGPAGQVSARLESAQTAAMEARRYCYDFTTSDGDGTVRFYFGGAFDVKPSATLYS